MTELAFSPDVLFMAWRLNIFTGMLYQDSASSTTSDISGGLDNLLLVDGTSNFTLVSDAVNDVLLLN